MQDKILRPIAATLILSIIFLLQFYLHPVLFYVGLTQKINGHKNISCNPVKTTERLTRLPGSVGQNDRIIIYRGCTADH